MNLPRLVSSVLFTMAAALGNGACSAPPDAAPAATADELRAPTKGDVDQVLLDAVAADEAPPDGLSDVRSWSVHYVQLRDPKNPALPDPVDAFNGFFLVAKDVNGTPLFFDTIALTDDGLAHFYFSVKTDESGNYFEMPLLAAADDPDATALAAKKVSWLVAEKTRLGHLIESRYATATTATASATIRPMDTAAQEWTAGAECAADLAVLALTASSPITMLVAQAAVDGTFALVDAVSGADGAKTGLENAATNATMAGVAKGVGKAVSHAVTKGSLSGKTVDSLKAAGGPALIVGMVAVVGYQMYEHGAKAGFAAAVNLLIPDACVKTYKNITQLPHNDVTKPQG